MLQANAVYERNNITIYNMGNIVRLCERTVDERWRKYDVIFASECKTASLRFLSYMYRRGHMVSLSAPLHVWHLDPASLCALSNPPGQGYVCERSDMW